MLCQPSTQFLGTPNRQISHLIKAGINRLDTAQGLQQCQRSFFAHTGHPGDVVDLIPLQSQQVNNQVGRHTELFDNTAVVHGGVGHGVNQRDMVVDQLGHVLVAGGYQHSLVTSRRRHRQCADNIIGLHSGDTDKWQTHRPDNGVDGLYLLPQLLGHGRPVGLVLGINFVAKGWTLGIKNNHHLVVGVIGNQLADHANNALHRTGIEALRVGQGRQGVVGAKQIRGTINQNQCGAHNISSPKGSGPSGRSPLPWPGPGAP